MTFGITAHQPRGSFPDSGDNVAQIPRIQASYMLVPCFYRHRRTFRHGGIQGIHSPRHGQRITSSGWIAIICSFTIVISVNAALILPMKMGLNAFCSEI
jgi:hypothetical protein